MCLSASLFSVSSTLYLLLRPLSSFPSSRPPCEPTDRTNERRFNPSLIVKINGFSRAFLYAVSLRFDLRRGPSQCAAATQRLPFYFRTHENRCVFDPCWVTWCSSIRASFICHRVRSIWSLSSFNFLILNIKFRFSQEFFVDSFK